MTTAAVQLATAVEAADLARFKGLDLKSVEIDTPFGAIVLGAVASVVCFFAVSVLKPKLGYDDALDAFGVHGIGGMIGAVGTGIVYAPSLGGPGAADYAMGAKLLVQIEAVATTIVWAAIGIKEIKGSYLTPHWYLGWVERGHAIKRGASTLEYEARIKRGAKKKEASKTTVGHVRPNPFIRRSAQASMQFAGPMIEAEVQKAIARFNGG
jgi:hypothetical protein